MRHRLSRPNLPSVYRLAGDAVSFHAFQQRAYVRRHCGFEAGMQERGRLDIRDRAQRKVEAVCVPIMIVPSAYFWAVAGSKPK